MRLVWSIGAVLMKAWQVRELGEPRDVLTLVDAPMPEPGPDEVVVRVLSVAANFPDVLMCRGSYQVRPELPFTPGIELCGEIISFGPGEWEFGVGDRVVGSPALSTGAYSEFAIMRRGMIFDAPQGLDDGAASAFHISYQTAHFALHRRAGIREGETLLVHAAAGGVGSAAVQLGKLAGASVVGVVGGSTKAAIARDLGADVVVDRHSEDFVAVVKEYTNGRGADVVFDPVGGEAFDRSTKCIAFEGRIVVVGFAGGSISQLAVSHALVKNYSVLGLHWGLYEQKDPAAVLAAHRELSALVGTGAVTPHVSGRLEFERVPDGLQDLADGRTTGRIVFVQG